MKGGTERTRVLITVMTYPHPNEKYTELVCTAGVTDRGEWVRLYPIDYRYRPKYQQFHKYQWIEVELEARGRGRDKRKESRKPNLDSIVVLDEPLPTAKGWAARRAIIDLLPHHTVSQLEQLYDSERTSLGIVRPTEIIDLEVRESDPKWKAGWQAVLNQHSLFEGAPKELRKLPFSFHYVFRCEDDQKPRRAMIEDWELGVLFLKEARRLGSDKAAAESVRQKFFIQMCDSKCDTRFFMGTRFPYNTWLVIGVFWPPKPPRSPLFEPEI